MFTEAIVGGLLVLLGYMLFRPEPQKKEITSISAKEDKGFRERLLKDGEEIAKDGLSGP